MGTVWYRRHGEARCVLVWLCGERQRRRGVAGFGKARKGVAGEARCRVVWSGGERRGR